MSILGWVLAMCVSGVSNVTEDFGAEISKEVSFRYVVISSMPLFMLTSKYGMLTTESHTVRSSVYQIHLTGYVGLGTSAM